MDPQGIFPHHFPEVAATEGPIRDAERALGFALDPEHRRFLGSADGWKGFDVYVNLFSTADTRGAVAKLRDQPLH